MSGYTWDHCYLEHNEVGGIDIKCAMCGAVEHLTTGIDVATPETDAFVRFHAACRGDAA